MGILNRGETKAFLTFEEQLNLLESRGLIVTDSAYALAILKRTNYYRLSAYSLTLRKDDTFYPDVTFENIYELYRFDECFRSIILKHSFVVEVSFRSYIAYVHSKNHGPLGYLDAANFSDLTRHARFLSDLAENIERSDDTFISHHKKDLGGVYPLWVAIEELTYGTLSMMYKNLLPDDRAEIADTFIGYSRYYVENWLQCCSYCRNIAAHGGRFYNRMLKSCPVRLSRKMTRFVDNNRPFAFVLAIYNLLPSQECKQIFISDLSSLFDSHPFALHKHVGFPKNWLKMLENQHRRHRHGEYQIQEERARRV